LRIIPCGNISDALDSVSRKLRPGDDYLFLDLPEDAVQDKSGFFKRLWERSRDPDMIVLPALKFQWDWVKYGQERVKARV
jgi:hypothetical protein